MPDSNDFRPGDNTNEILRKLLNRFAQFIGQGISLNVSDVEIGAVEIKDATTDNRAAVVNAAPGAGTYGMAVYNVGGGGGGGDATAANQVLGNASLSSIDSKTPALGQVTMAASSPVVIASNQSSIPVTGTFFQGTQPVSGTVAVTQSTSPWVVSGTVTTAPPANASANVTQLSGTTVDTNSGSKSAGTLRVTLATDQVQLTNSLKVDGSAVTQPVSVAAAITAGGITKTIKDTTAVSTSPAYTAGDAVGAKRTLTSALRISNGTCILDSITILDRANQKAGLEILIFDANPTNATITDNAAFVYSTDDLKVVARITVSASDYVTLNSKAVVCLRALGVAITGADGSTSLYAAVVTTGTPTFAATTDVQVSFGFLQD